MTPQKLSQVTSWLALITAVVLAPGCEVPEQDTAPADRLAAMTYFHNGTKLSEKDPHFLTVMTSPSLVTMVDAQFPKHAWLYTSPAEERLALRHHEEFAAKQRGAAKILGTALESAKPAAFLIDNPDVCQPGSWWFDQTNPHQAPNFGGYGRPYTDEPTMSEAPNINDAVSGITIQYTTVFGGLMPSTRVFQHEWYGGNSLRLLPPPDANHCAVYNMTDYVFCAFTVCTWPTGCRCGGWQSWNDQISSLRHE
jgi:hypothetical protein